MNKIDKIESDIREIDKKLDEFMIDYNKKKVTNGLMFKYMTKIDELNQKQIEKIEKEIRQAERDVIEKIDSIEKKIPSNTFMKIVWLMIGALISGLLIKYILV